MAGTTKPIGGFTGGGGITWESKANDFTAEKDKGYLVDSSGGDIDVTMPGNPADGDTFYIADDGGNFSTHPTILLDAKIFGVDADTYNLTENHTIYRITHISSDEGWNISYLTVGVIPTALPTHGYASGGLDSGYNNEIDRRPFASDTSASNVGDLTVARSGLAGQSGSGYIFAAGGTTGSSVNVIDKCLCAAEADASDHGDLSETRDALAGHSGDTYGFTSGGRSGSTYKTTVDRFLQSANVTASGVGDLNEVTGTCAGTYSSIYGYNLAGANSSVVISTVQKFPLGSTGFTASDIGDTLATTSWLTGMSDTDYGYVGGGNTGSRINVIQRHPFASDTGTSDVGDLTESKQGCAGQSDVDGGYGCAVGGYIGSAVLTMDKYAYGSSSNASDIGDLTVARQVLAGQQG